MDAPTVRTRPPRTATDIGNRSPARGSLKGMRSFLRVIAVLGVALLVVGCSDDDQAVSAGGEGDAAIEGEFVATGVQEAGDAKQLVEGTTIRLRLEDGTLTASAGCNSIAGDASIDDAVLRVTAVSTTEMGCDAPRHSQDEWLAGVLSSEPTVERTDDGFVLRADDVVITFVDESIVEPDVPLVGTTWIADGFIEGGGPDGAVSSAPGDPASVVFADNGFVTGDDGCNGFGYGGEAGADPTDGIRYEVTNDHISFSGSAVSTLIGCPDHDPARFYAILSGSVTWTIDGDNLTLLAPDGSGVMYRAQG